MKKKTSIVLLSIISVLMAFMIVMTFIRFPIGMKNYNSVLGAIETDYDISGGTAYTFTLSEDNIDPIKDENIQDVLDTIEYRINALGYKSYSVKAIKNANEKEADYDIRVELKAQTNKYGEPDTTTLVSDVAAVAAYGELEFFGGESADPTEHIFEDMDVISDASYNGMETGGDGTYYFGTKITFTSEAYDFLMDKLEAGSYYLSIKLGDTTLLSGSSSVEKEYFDGKSIVLRMSTTSTDADTVAQFEASSRQTALQIKSGGLGYKFDVSDGVAVSSPYGENVGLISIIAVSALLLLSMIVLAVLYKGFGLIADLSMILFILIEVAMLIAIPGIVVSIGSVIGIIFATILCADGMIITGQRIKEELKNKKTVKASFNAGFKRSLMPIINTTVVSAVVAGLLLIFSTGALYGFAVTFGIGVLVSIIASTLFTRMFASLILPIAKNKEDFFGGEKSVEE